MWRKGTWVLRGETEDDTALPNTGLGEAVSPTSLPTFSRSTKTKIGIVQVSWSACSDAQRGYEYIHENKSGGVMTDVCSSSDLPLFQVKTE